MTKKQIYYVDDEEDLLIFASNFFKKRGFIVETFNSGEDVLWKLQLEDPDLIITDYRRDGLCGLEFLKAVRQEIRNGKSKILPVTGFNEGIKKAGHLADASLSKPLDLDKLLDTINHLLTDGVTKG